MKIRNQIKLPAERKFGPFFHVLRPLSFPEMAFENRNKRDESQRPKKRGKKFQSLSATTFSQLWWLIFFFSISFGPRQRWIMISTRFRILSLTHWKLLHDILSPSNAKKAGKIAQQKHRNEWIKFSLLICEHWKDTIRTMMLAGWLWKVRVRTPPLHGIINFVSQEHFSSYTIHPRASVNLHLHPRRYHFFLSLSPFIPFSSYFLSPSLSCRHHLSHQFSSVELLGENIFFSAAFS